MTPQELKAIRKELGWSQVALANSLHRHPDTIAGWEQNERGISEEMETAIRAIHKARRQEAAA